MEEDSEINITPDQQQPPAKPKKGCLSRLLRVTLITALALVGLNVLLYVLLSIPFIQNKLVGYATDELKAMTGTEIRIDKIRLSFFNHATIEGLYIEDLNKDTLVYARLVDAKLSPWRLLKTELRIDKVRLDDFVIHVNANDSASDYNFQFLIDAFSSDTTQVKGATSSSSLQIIISQIALSNGRLHYDILSDPQTSAGVFNVSHIALSAFDANLNLYSIDPKKLNVHINSFELKEQCGLQVETLKGHVTSAGSLFKVNGLLLELADSRIAVDKLEYDIETAAFALFTDDVEISPTDMRHFLPEAKFITDKLTAKIDVAGKLPQIDAKTIYMTLGDNVVLDGSAYIGSYKELSNSDVKANIKKLSLSPKGITDLARLGDSTFVAPDILAKMGMMNLTANLTGKLNNFHLAANASIGQGSLQLKAAGATDTTFSNFDVKARLSTENFDLGGLLADTTLNHLSFHIDANVLQNGRQPLMAEATGAIDLLQYQHTDLRNLPITAYYNNQDMGLSLQGDLPIGKLALTANMTQAEIPDTHVYLKVDDLDVPFFYQDNYWYSPRLSFRLNGDIKGLDLDKMSAKITLDSLSLKDSTFNFTPGLITLEIDQAVDSAKSIVLESNYLSANIIGKYTFSTLPYEISNMMHDYLSNVFLANYQVKKNLNDFFFTLNVENTEELGQIFHLPIDVVEPMSLKGRINTIDRQIAVLGFFPLLRSGNIDIKDGELDIFNIDSTFNITLVAAPQAESSIYDFSLKLNGANNSIHSFVEMETHNVGDSVINIKGNIESMTQFTLNDKDKMRAFVQVYQSNIDIGNMQLNLHPARILYEEGRTMVKNFGIDMNRKRYFYAQGYVSDLAGDTLTLSFDKAQIGDFLSSINVNHVKASIDGDIKLTKITDKPEVYTRNLRMEDIIIFSDTLGTLDVYLAASESIGGVQIDSKLQNGKNLHSSIQGTVKNGSGALDLKIRMDRFPLGWMEPFMAGTLNKLSGSISAQIDVKGTTKAPITSGFLGFNNTSFGIDYTNVAYTISDTIDITPDKIGFSNLTMLDNEGNKAIVNATVTHHNFNNLKYTLDTRLDKLMFLNTQSRTDSMFYGKVYATGTVRVSGDEENIRLNMAIRNDKKSTINILIPETSDAMQYQSVVYINVPEEKRSKEVVLNIPKDAPLPLTINSNITLTPDIMMRVVIDPATGDEMHVIGDGKIAFVYDMKKDNMTTYGDYTINDGSVRLNMQGIKKFEFRIREGSKLNFIGDPTKTKFNITAYRRVKADLKTLDSSFETDGSSPKVHVDCVLGISGNINQMTVTYDIELPDASDDIKNKVKSIIATDEQRVTQFAYLVIGNTFHSQSGGGTNIGSGMWTSVASSTLSSGLNSLLGNVLGDKWEIGTNIESSDGTFNDVDMSVDVSTRIFNERLKLHTNVGYNQSTTTESSFIGDFDAEYQLSRNWLIRAFNKTNDRFYTQAPMTQGVGLVYTKEAATLKQLFIPRKRRVRRNQNIATPEKIEETKTTDKQAENTAGN